MELPVRAGLGVRRRPRILRASARLPLGRIVAALALVATSAAAYTLTTSDAFTVRAEGVEIHGAVRTDPALIRAAVASLGEAPPNAFRIQTAEIERALGSVTTIVEARARVVLPDRLVVEVSERRPLLVWRAGADAFLVDIEGLVFAKADPGASEPLPVVVDRRPAPASPAVGARLDPVELEAVRRLGALTPELLGSRARRLELSVTEEEGFVVEARPNLWRAVFGLYTRNLRPPSLIDEQVQCLRALLAGRELRVATVLLAPEGDRCGTFEGRGRGD